MSTGEDQTPDVSTDRGLSVGYMTNGTYSIQYRTPPQHFHFPFPREFLLTDVDLFARKVNQ
jgi:hypothetical protein